MAKYFDLFPKVSYDIDGKQLTKYKSVTNVFFRLRVIRDVLSNSSTYYEHLISDGDTPEILADKVYGDPEAHWIILMTNDIIDAQYEWPLTYNQFHKYIAKKYKSQAEADEGHSLTDNEVIAWTQNTTNANSYHHYEKVIKRENASAGVVTEYRYIINKTKIAQNVDSSLENITFDYFQEPTEPPTYGDYGSVLADVSTYVPINTTIYKITSNTTGSNSNITGVTSGQTIIENIYGEGITYYDYEDKLNTAKRSIKIIKPEFYGQIIREFNEYTGLSQAPFIRRLRV